MFLRLRMKAFKTFGHCTIICVLDGKWKVDFETQCIESQYQIHLIHNTFSNDKGE